MASSIPHMKRYSSMPALNIPSSDIRDEHALKQAKRSLLKELKDREKLLNTLLVSNQEIKALGNSAPAFLYQRDAIRRMDSPVLESLKKKDKANLVQRKLVKRTLGIKQQKKPGKILLKNKTNIAQAYTRVLGGDESISRDVSLMKARTLASHAGIWHTGKSSESEDMSFLLDNRVPPKQLPSAMFMSFPATFSEGNTIGFTKIPEHANMNAFPYDNDYNLMDGGLGGLGGRTPRMPTPHDKRYRKPIYVVRTSRMPADPIPGHYRNPCNFPQGRIGRILGPAVPSWKAQLSKLKKNMSLSEWNDFVLRSFYLEAAGGSGGDLGRGKRDTQELADLITTKGYRYGEILRNAKLEQNDREDEMTIHGVTRGNTLKNRRR